MLRNGSSGTEVEELQRALMRKGFTAGNVDGVFGPKTEAAVRRFQERAGLAADGIAGPMTLAALAERAASGAPQATEPEEEAAEESDKGPEAL